MHGREHVVVIRPNTSGLMLHTLFFANEVSRPEAAVDHSLVSEKELEPAKMLVNAGTAPFDPAKLKDTYKEKILRVIESRAETAVPVRATSRPNGRRSWT
jgi:DNA end-binding protein Ku